MNKYDEFLKSIISLGVRFGLVRNAIKMFTLKKLNSEQENE